MKAIRFILVAFMICNIISCNTQGTKKVTDKTFQVFLDKFKTINPPINYKTIKHLSVKMTEEEAIKFLHKSESELYPVMRDVGENDEVSYHKEENIPGCKFKYMLNDSVYVLCILETILGANDNISLAFLYTFTHDGKIIDKNLVCRENALEEGWIYFVVLDKTHVRVFYYEANNTREKEGFLSTVYYVNYEITGNGIFVEKDKSEKTFLKNRANFYCSFAYSGQNKMEEDDPMNEYDY